MAITGIIAQVTRSKIPEAWNILLSHPGYGELNIQNTIDTTKYFLFNDIVDASDEMDEYNPLIVEYCALIIASKMVFSAAEIINNSSVQRTMFGNQNQQETWLNRYQNYMDLKARLLDEAKQIFPLIVDDLPSDNRVKQTAQVGWKDGIYGAITDDPTLFDYTFEQRNDADPVDRSDPGA